ncbi:hypothetical protein BC941DRAFT_498296 [Chlamydoabsidia padenii]|nr:hypothetical protein BC941DRAFT_498296 [Chlamydoabsidia padenii]
MALTEDSLTSVITDLELIKSIYFDNEEFTFASATDATLYDQLLQHYDTHTLASLQTHSRSIGFQIQVCLKDISADSLVLVVDGRLGLADEQYCQLTIPSSAKQNQWLDRTQHQQLTQEWDNRWCHQDDDDRASRILIMLEQVPSLVEHMVKQYEQQQERERQEKDKTLEMGPIKCLREWLWLPMIYTKEKRGHIVDWAPSYGITGFLFAGKPGCLCLEGSEKSVISFINDIKTISWADIPAGHKKISTKYQERFICDSMAIFDQDHRKFTIMQELKFDTSGKFRNHNDLDMLKKWMVEHKVEDAFGHLFDYE